MQVAHYLPRTLRDGLQDLSTLALDLRWNWHRGTDDLWRMVDAELWDSTQNPWLILESVSDRQLADLAGDKTFLEALRQQIATRDEYYRQ
jgi:starch phosphorylase